MGYKFFTTCIDVQSKQVPALIRMIENGQQITRRTFLKYVEREVLWEVEHGLGYSYHPACGLTMAGDFHVTYYKSKWNGHPCVYFRWSGIEYVFVKWRSR